MRFTHPEISHPLEAFLFGLAIVGAAFMLSWAAEVAQLDISAGLAIAILALIAVLPEYAVDFVFAQKGGESFAQTGAACLPLDGGTESPCSLALANMTGANRLLIGVGLDDGDLHRLLPAEEARPPREDPERPLGRRAPRPGALDRDRVPGDRDDLLAHAAAEALDHADRRRDPGRRSSSLYSIRVSRAPAEEPHLVGPARYLGTFGDRAPARHVIGAIAVFAAAVILLFAEQFAEALVLSGEALGVSEFLLVQWVAPLASEAPELLVAGLYAWRLNTNAGLGTLVSSKVNQWTLLVGTLPIVFAIAAGGLHGLPLDTVQREELFLTAAQSFFAVAVISNLTMSLREALFLFGCSGRSSSSAASCPEQSTASSASASASSTSCWASGCS